MKAEKLKSTRNRRGGTSESGHFSDARREPGDNRRSERRCAACPAACCRSCAYAGKVRHGGRVLYICVNRPDAPGLMRKVPAKGVCRNYRPRKTSGGRRREPKSPPADETRYIALTFDRFAIVDAHDFQRLVRFKWTACRVGRKFYARRNEHRTGIWMHREIMQPPKGMVVDHVNGNGVDNSRANQRVCTPAENGHNSRPHGRSSRFKGVSYNEFLNLWQAGICINRQTKTIGYFDDEIEAAKAYDREALRRFGPFAWLNFPEIAGRPRRMRQKRRFTRT